MNNQYSIVRFASLIHGQDKKFPVEDWDIQKATNLVNLEKYKCFWFEKIESDILQDEPKHFTVKKTVVKRSGYYFINGFIETLADVQVRDSELADTMEQKGWDRVVSGINHNWCYQFDNKDNLVELK